MPSISRKHSFLVSAIQTNCIVTPSVEISTKQQVSGCEIESTVWDTGATNTIISPSVVQALCLIPFDKTQIEGVGGVVNSYVYKIDLYIDKVLQFKNIEVLSGDIGDYDLIIGMDIITLGDFVISNKEKKTWFSFRYPAEEHILLS